MANNQALSLYQKPSVLLSLILFVFIAKGLFFSAILPIFQGPDEQIHYATIQFQAEPQEKSWAIIERPKDANNGNDISTYHLSEETIETAKRVQFDEIKWQETNIQSFSQNSEGPHESEIGHNSWKRYIDIYPANASSAYSLYYVAASHIERSFSDQSIFFRFFAIRVFSIIIGTLAVFIAYFVFKKAGLSKRHSLLLTAIVAFQPMFSFTAAIVNIDIMLILAFTLYLYAGVSLLRDGFNWHHAITLIVSIAIGIFSKGPGLTLIVTSIPLLTYLYLRKRDWKNNLTIQKVFIGFAIVALIILVAPKDRLASMVNFGLKSHFSSPTVSLQKYFDKTLTQGNLRDTVTSYWGNFGWLDTPLPETLVKIIWFIEILALLNVVRICMLRRPIPQHLPQKPYLLFSLGMLIALQLAIRFYDWRVFDIGGQIQVGTPGRYFLPNIVAHMLLVCIGLGLFLKRKQSFDLLLKGILVLVVMLNLYSLFFLIIPRYYL